MTREAVFMDDSAVRSIWAGLWSIVRSRDWSVRWKKTGVVGIEIGDMPRRGELAFAVESRERAILNDMAGAPC